MITIIKRLIKSNTILFQCMKQCLLYARFIKSIGKKSIYDFLPQFPIADSFVISNKGQHSWFGYYDKSPMNVNSRYLLYLRVGKKAPKGGEAEICIYDIQTKMQRTIGKTQTWNWQQGAMEQWIDEKVISYNCFNSESNEYYTKRVDIKSGETYITNRAAYSYNQSFTKYLSLNFYRLDKFAKGYGYSFEVDSMDPYQDGIWEVCVEKNESKLILSLAEVLEFEGQNYMLCMHYINHVAYCPNERFIIFIHRWLINGGEFSSRLLKYDLQEKRLLCLLDNGHVSHYCWKSSNELLVFATNEKGERGYLVVDIETGRNHIFDGMPSEDGHPTFSNDSKFIITDTYPNNLRNQFLFIYKIADNKLFRIDKLYSPFNYFNESRCDLHPRWSKDNQFVIVDNTAQGYRTLKLYRVENDIE